MNQIKIETMKNKIEIEPKFSSIPQIRSIESRVLGNLITLIRVEQRVMISAAENVEPSQ